MIPTRFSASSVHQTVRVPDPMSTSRRAQTMFKPTDQATAAILMPKAVEPRTAVVSAML